MNDKQRFRVLPEHVTLLQNSYVGWGDCEFGAAAIDCKYPYGDSMVIDGMAVLLGVPLVENSYGDKEVSAADAARLHALHQDTRTVLQIFLRTGSMQTGLYEADAYRVNWVRIGD